MLLGFIEAVTSTKVCETIATVAGAVATTVAAAATIATVVKSSGKTGDCRPGQIR